MYTHVIRPVLPVQDREPWRDTAVECIQNSSGEHSRVQSDLPVHLCTFTVVIFAHIYYSIYIHRRGEFTLLKWILRFYLASLQFKSVSIPLCHEVMDIESTLNPSDVWIFNAVFVLLVKRELWVRERGFTFLCNGNATWHYTVGSKRKFNVVSGILTWP